MTASPADIPGTARITIGVRHYHAATGTYTTVREPRAYTPTGFDPLGSRFPPCTCHRCHQKRASR